MSSTAVSTFLAYNPPVVTTHCGEVYCSLNLEYFLINCRRCSLGFNLLSCNLFIKHVKECIPSEDPDPGDQNPANQDISNYTIDNLLKDASRHNSLAEDTQNEVNDDNHQLKPFMALKLEMVKETDEAPNSSDDDIHEDVEYLTDFQDEDDLTIDKVIRRKMIEGIIDEYKKHPTLWDVKEKATNRGVKKHHYKQIRKVINSKFKMTFTDNEVRTQIQNLRSGYKRVLKRKERFEKNFSSGKMRFDPQLWYFDRLSFIEGTINDIEVEPVYEDENDAKAEVSDDEELTDSANEQLNQGMKKERRERPSCKVLSEPKIISDVIAEYKRYPFLWDQTAPLYNDKYARKDAFRQITAFVNNKHMKNVTDKELRQQIVNLRSGYRRVQRKKHSANYRISLWYYDELSFIDHKSNQAEEACQMPEEIIDDKSSSVINPGVCNSENPLMNKVLEETQDYEIFHHQSNGDDDDDYDNGGGESQSARRKSDKKITLTLIDEYKQHPCLWNNYLYKTSSRFNRYDAVEEITTNVNTKFNTTFTETEIRNKLLQLRGSYRRVLRKKEAFQKKHANAKRKFHPQLWYFDKMSFIGTTDSDFAVSRRKARKIKSEDQGEEEKNDNAMKLESDDDSDVDMDFPPEDDMMEAEEQSDDEEEYKTNGESITKNRELLTAIIEEYKKMPCLWAVKHYTNDNHIRRRAYGELVKIINAKFNTQFTRKELSLEIIKLRSTYKRIMRRQKESSEFKSKVWYADMLSFIERKPDMQEIEQDVNDLPNCNIFADESPTESVSGNEDGEGIYQRKRKLKSREHVFEIIDLYKAAPILWDTKHHQYNLRVERKKTIEKIIATLSQEHDFHLTIEEFRYQIRFLRESFFRAVRHETAAKKGDLASKYAARPFFYDRLSFLEPFADKRPLTAPELQIRTKPEHSEDFTLLTENRQLMLDFIELYKAHGCLWDQKDKDKNNQQAHSEAYDKIMNFFLQHDIIYTKEQVLSAISFLHSTVVNTQKAFEFYDTDNISEPPIWYYEHLQFLGKIPRIKDKYCSHCDQHFRSLVVYEKHKIEIAGDYPYKCGVCNAGFLSRSKYAYHQITHKEPHKCNECGFQAYDKHNFNVHMRRHKGIHPFKCQNCDKGFVTSTELNRHMRMHTGEKPFICDICGKTLAANSEFNQHMKRHRNQRDHKCDICGSAFYTPKTLRDHMMSHSSERTHICEVCGAAFKRKKTLHQHKALHLEKKKHECKICGKLFAQKAGVYSHMKSHGLMPGVGS